MEFRYIYHVNGLSVVLIIKTTEGIIIVISHVSKSYREFIKN